MDGARSCYKRSNCFKGSAFCVRVHVRVCVHFLKSQYRDIINVRLGMFLSRVFEVELLLSDSNWEQPMVTQAQTLNTRNWPFLFSPSGVGWGRMSAYCPRSVKLAANSSSAKREIFQREAFSKSWICLNLRFSQANDVTHNRAEERGQPLTRCSRAQTHRFVIKYPDV